MKSSGSEYPKEANLNNIADLIRDNMSEEEPQSGEEQLIFSKSKGMSSVGVTNDWKTRSYVGSVATEAAAATTATATPTNTTVDFSKINLDSITKATTAATTATTTTTSAISSSAANENTVTATPTATPTTTTSATATTTTTTAASLPETSCSIAGTSTPQLDAAGNIIHLTSDLMQLSMSPVMMVSDRMFDYRTTNAGKQNQ